MRRISPSGRNKKKLTIVFGLTAAYMVAEVIGGLLTKSLALLADAAHMFTDVAALGLALLAIRFAERPATPEKTYGYYRAEILAALANAVVLMLISFFILYEAWERFWNPPQVLAGPMLLIAVLGLGINLIGMRMLAAASGQSLNLRGAYLELLSDALGSIGVITAAAVIWATGWYPADPLISAAIGLFVIPRTWSLLKQAVHILMEGTPSHLDTGKIEEALKQIPDVVGVHDLHVWTVTSGFDALSGHLVIRDLAQSKVILSKGQAALKHTFGIHHVTLQIEDEPPLQKPGRS